VRFGIVELSLGMIEETSRNWSWAHKRVERAQVSRWYNPVLIVIPDDYKVTHEEGEVDLLGPIEELVVAVPDTGMGYGAQYVDEVNENRERFGLPGFFSPSSLTLDVIKAREKFSKLPIGEAFKLLAASPGEMEDPRDVEEKGSFLDRMIRLREERQGGK